MNKLNKIIVCADMAGCPNRCKHCWLGATSNGNMSIADLEKIAYEFRNFTDSLEVTSWYREPDFRADYKELWELEQSLSDFKTPHFELMSYWRIVRDDTYADWLYSLGVRACQITLFGTEATTDYFVGRKGAYQEIIKAINILLEHGIAPRLQIFVNQINIDELPFIENLITDMKLVKRCQDIGQTFQVFIHQGSCDGENEKFYNSWIRETDLHLIPAFLAESSVQYSKKRSIKEVFGETENILYNQLINYNQGYSLIDSSPVFYIDASFNVFPNISQPAVWWSLGNFKKDSVKDIIENYVSGNFYANRYLQNTSITDLVKKYGNPDSLRLFSKSDYIIYLLNQACKNSIR